MVKQFSGYVIDGRYKLDDKVGFQQATWDLNGKKIMLSVSQFRPQRSLEQNKWYWGVAIPILSEALGYDHDEMHDALKMKLLPKNLDTPLPTVGSTTKLNTLEFSHFMDDVVRIAAELGVALPLPGEPDGTK